MPAISVIIPNYNHAPFLEQRIDSVLNQTFQDFELIILDDCSTDWSKKIIGRYRGHPKVSHIIFNHQNSGSTFKQWKKGIEMSQGNYIWLAESDDYAREDFIESLYEKIRLDKSIIISYCQSLTIDQHDNPLFVCEWADALDNERWKQDYIADADDELAYLKYRNVIVNASAVIFKKPADLTIFDDIVNMRFCGDWLFWKRLLANGGKVAFSHQIFNFYRMHTNTTRHTSSLEREKQRFKELNLFIDKYHKFFDPGYDWMPMVWFEHRSAFKGTLNYFIPPFPVNMQIKIYLMALKKMMRKLKLSPWLYL